MDYRYATDDNNTHLGGNILEGDPFTYSPYVWDYLVDRFAVESVLDLGSGLGYSSKYFHKKDCKVIAVDGMDSNVQNAVFPTIKHDLTNGPVKCKVDLVHCQEVAEHIDKEYVSNLMLSLACGKFVLFTHALPGQLGHHHVNLQPPEYWKSLFALYNMVEMPEDTKRVRLMADMDNAPYVRDTGMVFVNRGRV